VPDLQLGWRNILAVPFFLLFFECIACRSACTAELLIDRTAKTLFVQSTGTNQVHCRVGIGSGGLRAKKNMADRITPSGEFVVDLILYQNPDYDNIDPRLLQRFSSATLLRSRQGLSVLFEKMNGLDFDHNGSSDTAYGIAYIGLEGLPNKEGLKPVTGPKLSKYNGTDYWFSIALHGTPNEVTNIGSAHSGGCVHVPARVLKQLIESKTVQIGTRVIIR